MRAYQSILGHMGVIVQAMTASDTYRSHHLAAVISMWAAKSALRTDIAQTTDIALMIGICQIALIDPPLDKNGYMKLISAYRDTVEFFYANAMDEEIDATSLRELAKFAASEDKKNSFKGEKALGWRLGSGFTEGTADADTFKSAYDTSLIAEKLKQQ